MVLKTPLHTRYNNCAVVCAGIGSQGSLAASMFFANSYRQLSKEFGEQPFVIVLKVSKGASGSAQVICKYPHIFAGA